jgi:hypothetical protein
VAEVSDFVDWVQSFPFCKEVSSVEVEPGICSLAGNELARSLEHLDE